MKWSGGDTIFLVVSSDHLRFAHSGTQEGIPYNGLYGDAPLKSLPLSQKGYLFQVSGVKE